MLFHSLMKTLIDLTGFGYRMVYPVLVIAVWDLREGDFNRPLDSEECLALAQRVIDTYPLEKPSVR